MIHVRSKYGTDCMIAGIACYTETPLGDIFEWIEKTFERSAQSLLAGEEKIYVIAVVASKYVPWLLPHIASTVSIKMPAKAIYLPTDPEAKGFAWTWHLKQKIYTDGDTPIIGQAHFISFGGGKAYDPEIYDVLSVSEYN